ncbi:hypothetical protein WN943_019457 [Citrus x changshan-huyou]
MSSKYLIVYHLTIEKNLWGKTRIQLQVCELVSKNGKRRLAFSFLVSEAVSVVLDHVFGNSKWAPLAAFLLSAFGFAINIYACFLERRRRSNVRAIRSQSDLQLEIVDIVFSALQTGENVENTSLEKGLEKRTASFGSNVVGTASVRIRQLSQELKRLASFSKRPNPPALFDSTNWKPFSSDNFFKFNIFATQQGLTVIGMDFERRRLPRHLRSPVGELVVCKNWKRGLAVLFLVLEAVSVVLDHVFGNSKWAPLAAFLLSAFGFAIIIYACFLGRRRRRRRSTIGVIRSQSDRQLEIVDIVFSALQFIATLIHFILMISDVKSNYNASVLLPLAFAIIAVIFVFRTEEIIENSFLEKGLETGQFHFPMLLELESGRCFKSLSGCVKFISETDGGAGWANVEKRYDEITASTNGVLPRARFGECIGIHNIHGDTITRDQLREFWDEINNQSFHSRLQIFFDIVGKNGVDRITEDELTEIICLSASADKFLNTQKKAEEFAAGIMEKLDPYYLGYITSAIAMIDLPAIFT